MESFSFGDILRVPRFFNNHGGYALIVRRVDTSRHTLHAPRRRYISQLIPFVFVACFSGDAVGVSLIGEPYLNRPARVVGRFGIAATSEM